MSVSIREFIRVTVSLEGAAAEAFGFGRLMGAFEHTLGSERINGPYTSIEEVSEAGFTSDDWPNVYAWASAVSQDPMIEQFFVGRIDAGDADLTESLEEIEAEAGDAKAWYILNIESRDEDDILLAAAFAEARTMIFMAQSSDQLGAQVSRITFAGVTNTPGDYSIRAQYGDDVDVTVTYTSAGSQTSAQIATALIAAWDADEEAAALADASTGGSGIVDLTFVKKGVVYTVTSDVAGGTAVVTTPTPATGSIGSQLNLAGLKRTALWFHGANDATDGTLPQDGYLDGAVSSRCGAFNLDGPGGVGNWAFKELAGITPDDVDGDDAADLYFVKTNLYIRLKSLNFTSKGTMAGGRRIDVTTSLDWLKLRLEEAILGELVGEPEKIPYTSAGLTQLGAAMTAVLDAGVTFGHISPDHERAVVVPDILKVSTANKINRVSQFTARCTLAGAIEEVEIVVTVEQ